MTTPAHASTSPTGLPADQLYVTHCQQGDSVHNRAGFSVRAASTTADELLQFLFDRSSYELPLDMWGTGVAPAEAPRRLALLKTPDGRAALIHSTYVEVDTRGRPGSYFSHVLVCDRLHPLDALATWGSTGWKADYPQGASQKLPRFPGLPPAGRLAEAALTAFLAADPGRLADDQHLATGLAPARLKASPGPRRDLLAAALAGAVRALAPNAGARNRLYLLAEPGLAALLLYGVCRLLPRSWTASLTFSTFETAHGTLRRQDLPDVVATYLHKPQSRALEPRYGTDLGYAVNAFHPNNNSPELRPDANPWAVRMVDLAARGDWKAVAQLHEFLTGDAVNLTDLTAAAQRTEAAERVAAGKPSREDVRLLVAVRAGKELVQRHTGRLRAAAEKALLAADGQWPACWGPLCEALDAGARRGTLHELLKAAPAVRQAAFVPLRLGLLKDWAGVVGGTADLPPEVAALADGLGPDDLHALDAAGLPDAWTGYVLARALLSPAAARAALAVLHKAGEGRKQAFVRAAAQLDPARRAQLLEAALSAPGPEAVDLLEHLLRAGCTVPGAALHGLLERHKLYEPAALCDKKDRMALLLDALADAPQAAQEVWRRWTGTLTVRILRTANAHDPQKATLKALLAARGTSKAPPPADVVARLEGWRTLVGLFHHPANNQTSPSELAAASQAVCGGPPDELLTSCLLVEAPPGLPLGALSAGNEEGKNFLEVFQHFYPRRHEDYGSYKEVAEQYFRVVRAGVKEGLRDGHQQAFLDRVVPSGFQKDLIEELTPAGLIEWSVRERYYERASAKEQADAAAEVSAELTSKRSRWLVASIGVGLGVLVLVTVVGVFALLGGGGAANGPSTTKKDDRVVINDKGGTTAKEPPIDAKDTGKEAPKTTEKAIPDKPKNGGAKDTGREDTPKPKPKPEPRYGDVESAIKLLAAYRDRVTTVRERASTLLRDGVLGPEDGMAAKLTDALKNQGDSLEQSLGELQALQNKVKSKEVADAQAQEQVKKVAEEVWKQAGSIANVKQQLHALACRSDNVAPVIGFLETALNLAADKADSSALYGKSRQFLLDQLKYEASCRCGGDVGKKLMEVFDFYAERPDQLLERQRNRREDGPVTRRLLEYLVTEQVDHDDERKDKAAASKNRARLAAWWHDIRPLVMAGKMSFGRSKEKTEGQLAAVDELFKDDTPGSGIERRRPADAAPPVALLASVLRDDLAQTRKDLGPWLTKTEDRKHHDRWLGQAIDKANKGLAGLESLAKDAPENVHPEAVRGTCDSIVEATDGDRWKGLYFTLGPGRLPGEREKAESLAARLYLARVTATALSPAGGNDACWSEQMELLRAMCRFLLGYPSYELVAHCAVNPKFVKGEADNSVFWAFFWAGQFHNERGEKADEDRSLTVIRSWRPQDVEKRKNLRRWLEILSQYFALRGASRIDPTKKVDLTRAELLKLLKDNDKFLLDNAGGRERAMNDAFNNVKDIFRDK